MTELEMYKGILDSYPYPIVFVDNDYIIRFLNKRARYHYYEERGYSDLMGKSLFDCHDNPESAKRICQIYEGIRRNGKEVFLNVNVRNERIYIQGVRNDAGEWIGFFERFERNCTL